MGFAGFGGEELDVGFGAVFEGDAVDAAFLVAGDEALLVVEGEADPGALGGFGDVVDDFGFEAGEEVELVAFEDAARGGVKDVAPRGGAEFGDGGGAGPGVVVEGGEFPAGGEGGGEFPGGAGFEEGGAIFFAAVEAGDEASDAAFVLGFDGDEVAAGLEEGGGFDFERGLPFFGGADGGAVEEDFGLVVAAEGEDEVGGDFFEVEGVAEEDGGVVGGAGRPDPLGGGGGVGDGASEGGEGEAREEVRGHHEGGGGIKVRGRRAAGKLKRGEKKTIISADV